MLKGSSLPYPKHEPWVETLGNYRTLRASQGSPSIPSIALRNRSNVHDDIILRGGGGDAGVPRTNSLMLSCPKCSSIKNVARCTLFSNRAMPVYCSTCKVSSTSSRWQCSHHESWLKCPFHRDQGFKCRSSRLARHSKPTLLKKHSSFKAMIKRLSRIGHLGHHTANNEEPANSIGAAGMPKQNDKPMSKTKNKCTNHQEWGHGALSAQLL